MRSLFLLAALLILPAAPLAAQAPAPLACDGDVATVRVSTIKPGGSLAGFMAAVAAHKAWYRASGVEDNQIFAARVSVRDEATRQRKYSDTEVMTFHINPPASSRTPNHGDDAYNAFVKMYRDNSDIKSEYTVCMPKASAR